MSFLFYFTGWKIFLFQPFYCGVAVFGEEEDVFGFEDRGDGEGEAIFNCKFFWRDCVSDGFGGFWCVGEN